MDLAPNVPVLAGTVFVTLLAYSSLWTEFLLTNHTLPNVLVYPYPSFKTLYEGRWFADVMIQLLGGSGVQAVQLVLAVFIKGVNAQILCAIFNERRPWVMLAVGLALSLHPAFLDYYAFTVDAVTFEIGDTFALLGIFLLARGLHRPVGAVVGCAVLFVLAIAAYQPKIALCAVLLLLWLASGESVRHPAERRMPSGRLSAVALSLAAASSALMLSVLVYYISHRFTVVLDTGGARQHVNDLGGMVRQALAAYPALLADFSSRVDYLPRKLSLLPMLVIIAGFIAALFKCYRVGAGALAVSAVSMIFLPIALQSSYVINDQTWTNVGRVLTPHAYLLAWCLIMLLGIPVARVAAGVVSTVLTFVFFIVASQEASAASLKSVFDQAKINRIVMRIEEVVPDLYSRTHPIVVVGELRADLLRQMKRYPNRLYGSQFATEAFIGYRQTELLNFYIGREVVVRPTADQRQSALHAAAVHSSWPAQDSVFLDGDTIVVVLDRYAAGTPATWIKGQYSDP